MRLSRWLLVLCSFFFVVDPKICRARLGETEKELQGRYGAPITPTPPGLESGCEKTLAYEKGPVTIVVGLDNGRSVIEVFTFYDDAGNKVPAAGEGIEQVKALLEENGGGVPWFKHRDPKKIDPDASHVWSTMDGKRRAMVPDEKPNMLVLQTASGK